MVDLAHAVLSGFIETVSRFGGHALGLRGDGLFAGFGGPPEFATMLALGACSFALDAVYNGVNSWLDEQELEHVQARAGIDAGAITFIRTGTAEHSEVNALGFAANFAAKCEKNAKSWEVIVGETARNALPAHPYFTAHEHSPKPYTRHGETRYYRFYDFGWRRALPHLGNVPEELLGASSSDVIGGWPCANGTFRYTGELVNARGATSTSTVTVNVTDAAPGVPVLPHDNWDSDGDYMVTTNLWWGTNASTYRLYENGELIDEQDLIAASPAAQHVSTAVGDRTAGTYEYIAEFSNAAGVTRSEAVAVVVK